VNRLVLLLAGCSAADPLEAWQNGRPQTLDPETAFCPPADHPDILYLVDRPSESCDLVDFICPDGFWWFDAPPTCGCGCARLGTTWDSSR